MPGSSDAPGGKGAREGREGKERQRRERYREGEIKEGDRERKENRKKSDGMGQREGRTGRLRNEFFGVESIEKANPVWREDPSPDQY